MVTPISIGGTNGVFVDVAPTRDGWMTVYRELGGPLVLLWFDDAGTILGGRTHRITTGSPEDSTFPRLMFWDNRNFIIYRTFVRRVWEAELMEVTNGELDPPSYVGRCYGNNPVAANDGVFAWQDDLAGVVRGLDLRTGPLILREEIRPTGLSRVDATTAWFIDEDRLTVPGMLNPVWAGDLVCGEGPNGGLMIWGTGVVRGYILTGECMTPRMAAKADHYAAVTWGGTGPRLALFRAIDVTPGDPPGDVSVNKPAAIGFFAFGPDRFRAPLPGNCRILVPEGTVVDNAGVAVAQYLASEGEGGNDLDNLEAKIATHKKVSTLPCIAYWTRGAQRVRVPRGADIVGVEMYRGKNEALDAFWREMDTAVGRCGPAIAITQTYDSNSNNHPDLNVLVPVYAKLMRERPNLLGAIGFTGIGRGGGLEFHPDLRVLYEALAKTVTGFPTFPRRPDVPVPPTPPDPTPPTPTPPVPPVPVPPSLFPEGDLRMLSTFSDPTKKMLVIKSVKKIDGEVCVLEELDGKITSIQPDGSVQNRDADANGAYERCRVSGSLATFQPVSGKFFTFGFVIGAGL